MEKRKWIGLIDTAEEDTSPIFEIERSTTPLVTETMRDGGQRTSLTILYQVGGAWQGSVQLYQTLDVPGTSHIDEEGAPAVPKDGLFVALPEDARDVEVRVIDRNSQAISEEIYLAPQAKSSQPK